MTEPPSGNPLAISSEDARPASRSVTMDEGDQFFGIGRNRRPTIVSEVGVQAIDGCDPTIDSNLAAEIHRHAHP